MNTLVLITDVFPYGSITETSFIAPEIEALSKRFDRVIIAPRMKLSDTPDVSDFPANVEVSDALIIEKTLSNKLKALPRIGGAILRDLRRSKGDLRDVIAYSAYVDMCRRSLRRFIKRYDLDLHDTLFYTFWFDFTTAALSLINGARFLTRAHGHDIYDERNFISPTWRTRAFEKMIACHPVSRAGVDYLRHRFPAYAGKIDLRHLGTVNKYGMNPAGHPGGKEITLAGIARLSPEKGVIRQMETLLRFASGNPEYDINYIHIGDGPQMGEAERLTRNLPKNLRIDLRGALHNDDVHRLLASTHIDALLLLSHSEGLPISLCEGISYGIPFLATDVGGIHEILPEGTLPLLPDSFSYSEFEKGLQSVLTDKGLRQVVRDHWQRHFDAAELRRRFADELAGIPV